jgi:hypothetical protein
MGSAVAISLTQLGSDCSSFVAIHAPDDSCSLLTSTAPSENSAKLPAVSGDQSTGPVT